MGILTQFGNWYISEFVTYTELLEQSLILLCELKGNKSSFLYFQYLRV